MGNNLERKVLQPYVMLTRSVKGRALELRFGEG